MAERRRRSSSSQRTRDSRRAVIRSEVNTAENMSKRERARKRKKMRSRKRRKKMFIGAVILILIFACLIGFATRKNGSNILLNGTSMGIVKTRSITKDDVVNSVCAMISEQVGSNVQIKDEIEIKGVHVSGKDEVLSTEAILVKLRDKVAYNVESFGISVNGEVLADLASEAEAREVLSYLNSKFTPEGVKNAQISYAEDVQIVSQFTDIDRLTKVEDAKEKITLGITSTKLHSVASGETLSTIASKYGMTLNELLDMNPQINVNSKIHIGQEIAVKFKEPLITVKASVSMTEKQTAEKEVEYQYDNTKSSSYKKIIQQGTGEVTEVTKEAVYVNGILESENVISTKVVTQAVKEIVCVGTR